MAMADRTRGDHVQSYRRRDRCVRRRATQGLCQHLYHSRARLPWHYRLCRSHGARAHRQQRCALSRSRPHDLRDAGRPGGAQGQTSARRWGQSGDWLHFIISLLCHDIGYVRGICRNDKQGCYVTGNGKETVELEEGATDASLTPYHIERRKLFVCERFAKNRHIEVEVLCANMEYTRFPVPIENEGEAASEYPALLRASDLIGQLADLSYMRKITALFTEFEETGMNRTFGYNSSAGLRAAYPKFF